MKTEYKIKFKKVVTDTGLGEIIKLKGVGNVAKALGMSSQYISMIIHGDITISEEIYFKIKDCISEL